MDMRDVTAITITDSNYRLLEYIKFSGTEYITANEKPTNNRYYYLNFALDSIVNDKFILATNGDSTTDGTFRVTVRTSTTSAQSRYGRNSSTNTNLATLSTDTFYQCRVRIVNDYTAYFGIANQSGTVLGSYTYSTAQTFTPANMNNFTIMGYNGSNLTAGKVYRYFYRIGDASGKLGAHCYPAQRKSDSVCGLYDILSNTFIPMQGTNITDAAAGPTVSEDFPLGVSKIEDSNGNIIWGSEEAFPYRRLEYIESTTNTAKNQFNIQFDFYCALGTSNYNHLDIDFQLTNATFNRTTGQYYGAIASMDGLDCRFGYADNYTSTFVTYVNGSGTKANITSRAWNTNRHTIGVYRGICWVDSVNCGNCLAAATGNGHNISLFNQKYDGSEWNILGKFYKLEIYNTQSDTIYYHRVFPCQRKSDGVIGVYNTVTGKFYTNSGTGTFTAGPVVDEYWDLTAPS